MDTYRYNQLSQLEADSKELTDENFSASYMGETFEVDLDGSEL